MTKVMDQSRSKDLRIVYDRYGLTLGVTRDGLEAWAVYTPRRDAPRVLEQEPDVFNREFFQGILRERRITFGLLEENIRGFLSRPIPGVEVLIAQGLLPVPGEDARIEFTYEHPPEVPTPKLLEGGKVDFKELNRTLNVRRGDVLARKVPATPGVPGKKVSGEEIPPRAGQDRSLVPGRNTVLSEDGLCLLANIDGTIVRNNSQLCVLELYTVSGDIDYSTGNIDFVGSVEVTGNVLSGFRLEAKNNVLVHGIVEAATILAGGNVVIRRGLQGAGKAEIRAGGSIEVKFANAGKLWAEGSIKAYGPVMHSDVSAGDRIELVGRSGVFSGGLARAMRAIEVESLGSEAGVNTVVEVGLRPELAEAVQKAAANTKVLETNLAKMEQALAALNHLKARNGILSPDREKLLLDSIKARFTLQGQLEEARRHSQMLESQLQEARQGYVLVRGVVYPGVMVRIGPASMRVDDPMRGVTFRYCDGQVVAA